MTDQTVRKEGEYPFYPIAPEHEVIRHIPLVEIIDDETLQPRVVVDYSGTFS